ncbi:host cell division inhibitory peptide Kil [Anaplasma marginale]
MAIQTKFTIATFIGDEKMFREAVDETAHFYLHAVGDGLNLHADRIATSVNQAYQRGTARMRRAVFTVIPGVSASTRACSSRP